MSEDFEKLERQIDEMLAELSPALEVEPPKAVIERTRMTTQRAVNEVWLAGQPTPMPSEETLSRVRSAMRRELAQSSERSTRSTRRMVRFAWPVVAAAAMIVISIGVFRNGASGPQQVTTATDSSDQTLDLFVQAAEQVWTEDTMIASLRIDLDSIEESMLMSSQSMTDGVEDVLEYIETQLDELFTEPEQIEYPVPWGAEDARLPVRLLRNQFVFMVHHQSGAIG